MRSGPKTMGSLAAKLAELKLRLEDGSKGLLRLWEALQAVAPEIAGKMATLARS